MNGNIGIVHTSAGISHPKCSSTTSLGMRSICFINPNPFTLRMTGSEKEGMKKRERQKKGQKVSHTTGEKAVGR